METSKKIIIKRNPSNVEIILGDITMQSTDAIVNAANSQLLPGGGVSGAIHRAAGPGLCKETASLGGCATGEAKITSGYNLKAKYVIHTVGPVYGESNTAAKLLRSCYLSCLKLAAEKGIKSISFPAISTGIFGYPVKEASEIAVATVKDFLKGNNKIVLVRFVLFDSKSFEVYKHFRLKPQCLKRSV